MSTYYTVKDLAGGFPEEEVLAPSAAVAAHECVKTWLNEAGDEATTDAVNVEVTAPSKGRCLFRVAPRYVGWSTDVTLLCVGVTTEQVEKLKHALGLDYPDKVREGVTWRDYFCAPDLDPDMEALVARGLMRRGAAINEGRDRYYHATPAGMALVGIREVSR